MRIEGSSYMVLLYSEASQVWERFITIWASVSLPSKEKPPLEKNDPAP